MEYKGYKSFLDGVNNNGHYYGHIDGIKDVITFQADRLEDVEQAFKDSVDDYLDWCKERGEKPCKDE